MSDKIYRQDAVDVVEKYFTNILKLNPDICADGLRSLPSAETERRDCGWIGIEDDYPVSIREVIDITAETGALYTQNRVRELKPYRLPKRNTGRWIEFPNHYAYKCSECGRVIETIDGKNNVCKHYPYCHCGAKMEVEHEQV